MRRLLLLGSMLFAVGGCTVVTGPGWEGSGTAAAFDADTATCDSAAFVHYPPMTAGVPGYYASQDEFCGPTAAGTNCMIINPGYLPQVKSSADTNAPPRAGAFHACMTGKGWHPVYQAEGEAFTPPGAPPRTSVGAALTYCEARFKGRRDTPAEAARFHDCVVNRSGESPPQG